MIYVLLDMDFVQIPLLRVCVCVCARVCEYMCSVCMHVCMCVCVCLNREEKASQIMGYTLLTPGLDIEKQSTFNLTWLCRYSLHCTVKSLRK